MRTGATGFKPSGILECLTGGAYIPGHPLGYTQQLKEFAAALPLRDCRFQSVNCTTRIPCLKERARVLDCFRCLGA